MDTFDNINLRIEKFLKEEGLTAIKFAEIMEIRPSNISHFLSGRNKPNFDFISRFLLRFPDINPDWFLNGIGEMYRNQVSVIDASSVSSNDHPDSRHSQKENSDLQKPFSFTQNSLFSDEIESTDDSTSKAYETISDEMSGTTDVELSGSIQIDHSQRIEHSWSGLHDDVVAENNSTASIEEISAVNSHLNPSDVSDTAVVDSPKSCEENIQQENTKSVSASDQVSPSLKIPVDSPESKLVKIVMFYDDMTFVEFNSRK